jgi:hypothetical protein
MTLKITLITPPDIYQNDNDSLLLLNVTEKEQSNASDWLVQVNSEQHLNVYFYQNETEVPWILHAMAASSYKYINIDGINGITSWLAGYILGKPNTFYYCSDPNVASLYSHINPNRVNNIVDFLERTLGANKQH